MNKSKKEVEDLVTHGVYLEKDGKRIDPKDFYKMELSNCCNAPVKVDTSEEGTSCYICTECISPCDIGGKSFKEEDV